MHRVDGSRRGLSAEPAAQWFAIVPGERAQMRQGCLLLYPVGREDQAILVPRADLAVNIAGEVAGQSLQGALLCLLKHLDNEGNGWRPYEMEASLLTQFAC